MFIVFNAFMQLEKATRDEAINTARLNAAAVIDDATGAIIADYRTEESENDEKG